VRLVCCYRHLAISTRAERWRKRESIAATLYGAMRSNHLTNRSSQLRERSRAGALAIAMRAFDFMKQSFAFATLAAASGRSAPSRYIKSHFMSRAVLAIAVIIGCSAVADAKPPAVSLSGGDGSSFSRAIVVKAPTDR